MLYFKQIPLKPSTMWKLDIIVCKDIEHVAQFCSKRFGASIEYYLENFDGDFVSLVDSTDDSECKGHRRIVLKLDNLTDKHVMVHELVHVLHYAGKYIGFNINFESQEWNACFMEMLWVELCKPNYEKIKK